MKIAVKRMGVAILAAVAAVIVPGASAQSRAEESITSFLTIVEKAPKAKGQRRPVRGVEINSKLDLLWDEPGLMAHLTAKTGAGAKGQQRSLESELDALRTGAEVLSEAQSRELDYRIALLGADEPQSVSKGPAQGKGQQALAGLQSFRADAIATLKGKKGPGSGYMRDLAAALGGPADDGFVALRESAGDIAMKASEEMKAKLKGAPTVMLFMSAHLVTPYGKPSQFHLEEYDKLQDLPKPYSRTRLVVDERTLGELGAAQEIVNLFDKHRQANLPSKASEFHTAVAKAFERLAKRMNLDALNEECDRMIELLRGVTEDRAGPVLKDIRALQAVLRPISRSKIRSAPTQAAALALFADAMNGFTKNVWDFVRKSPNLLGNLVADLKAFAEASPGVVTEDSIAFFGDLRAQFVANFDSLNSEAESLNSAVNDTSRALMLTEDFALVAKDLVPREIGDSVGLDSSLNVANAHNRRPGDRIVVRAEVRQLDGEEKGQGTILETGEQTLQVEAYGLYPTTSGSLLLVDPRSSIPRSIKYEPTVGLGFHYHYGMKGSDTWNRVLNPGMGLSFSMLDFDDDKTFELGAALGMTLFNDQLWVGYGRNLTAGGDYFYLGFNPYTLTRLLRGRK